jgi:hypothetical protein
MTTGREPLTQEERELAAGLARLGASEGPSPALDAKILAAAHAAARRGGAAPARRRRWPVAIGAAASLVVVLGIAWQLRPGQDTEQAYSESDFVRAPRAAGPSAAEELPMAAAVDSAAAAAAPQAPPTGQEEQANPAAVPAAPSPPAPAPAPLPPPDEAGARRDAFPAEAAETADTAPAPSPAAEAEADAAAEAEAEAAAADIVFDAPAPVAAPAPPPPAPTGNTTGTAARAAPISQRRQSLEKAGAADAAASEEVTVTGARTARDRDGFSDAELDERPPATADSPQVQRAWLQRIRELVAEGDTERAQASLAEFKRRNPHYALPDDLGALLP